MIQNQNPNIGAIIAKSTGPKADRGTPSPAEVAGSGNLREISAKAVYAALKQK
jgi:hypothetical protein